MVQKILRAKIQFFDSNPIGRIQTRFSKDITALDQVITIMVQMATFSAFRTFYIFATMAVLYWPLVPICLFSLIFMVIIVRKAMVP